MKKILGRSADGSACKMAANQPDVGGGGYLQHLELNDLAGEA